MDTAEGRMESGEAELTPRRLKSPISSECTSTPVNAEAQCYSKPGTREVVVTVVGYVYTIYPFINILKP